MCRHGARSETLDGGVRGRWYRRRRDSGDGLASVGDAVAGARRRTSGRVSGSLPVLPDDCTMYVPAVETHPASESRNDHLVSTR